jgi:hypothetical protein
MIIGICDDMGSGKTTVVSKIIASIGTENVHLLHQDSMQSRPALSLTRSIPFWLAGKLKSVDFFFSLLASSFYPSHRCGFCRSSIRGESQKWNRIIVGTFPIIRFTYK